MHYYYRNEQLCLVVSSGLLRLKVENFLRELKIKKTILNGYFNELYRKDKEVDKHGIYSEFIGNHHC